MHLSYAGALLRAQGRAAESRKIFQPAFLSLARLVGGIVRQITIIDGLHVATFILFDIAARSDPFTPPRRQAFAHITIHGRIAIRAARVIDAHRWILFQFVFEVASWALIDFTEGDSHADVLAFDVDAARVGKLRILG